MDALGGRGFSSERGTPVRTRGKAVLISRDTRLGRRGFEWRLEGQVERKKMIERCIPLSFGFGTHMEIKARFWPWLSGKRPSYYSKLFAFRLTAV